MDKEIIAELAWLIEMTIRETPEGNFPYLLLAERGDVSVVCSGSFFPERTRNENIAFALAGMERDLPGASPVAIYKLVGGRLVPILTQKDMAPLPATVN